MLALLITCVVLIAGLAFFAMLRSKPSRLKLSASVLKFVSFSIEVESQDERQRPELPPGSADMGEPRSYP